MNLNLSKKAIIAGAVVVLASFPTSSPVWADDEPDAVSALEGAIACSEAISELAASFTLSYRLANRPPVTHRYDASTDEWTFLTGNLSMLGKRGRQDFENVSQRFGKKGGLVPQDLTSTMEDLALVETSPGTRFYSFAPKSGTGQDPMPASMTSALSGRLLIDSETGCISGYAMTSKKAFKSSFMSRIDDFEFSYSFAVPDGGSVPLLAGFKSAAKGSVLMSGFEKETIVTITDVEVLL